MSRKRQSVELSQQRYRGAVVASAKARGDAGNRDVLGVLDSQLGELIVDETGCLELSEAQLGAAERLLGDVDDPLAPPVDGGLR